ncbi:MAG: bifunctional 4-hydroxy-2-oxoglutarate aldolase/2-dehydro-3-deoxy-phosphogluconate aldolase [Salibacteraceae bacterium]
MKKEHVVNLMLQTRVIPLFYEADIVVARQLIDACYAGGARVIEFTNRGNHAPVVFDALINYSKQHYPELALGVGSIANEKQAALFIEMGAHFLVSPFLDEGVSETCRAHDILWSGGCGTLTEMQRAHLMGMPIIKAFPGNVLGPAFVKAAQAPCPWFNIMPTGGVKPEEENLKAWFEAGAKCVGMGSRLFVKDDEGHFQYSKITELLQFSILLAQDLNTSA